MPFDLTDYEPVEDRLRAFWSEHPDGRIETIILGDADGRFLVEARAYRDLRDPAPSASGLAMERETDRGVNATSALENCETSAIGRALANLGYAAKGKRPSREEMSKASPAPGPAVTPRAGVGTTETRTSPQAGDTSSAGGEAADVGTPGEVVPTGAGGGSQTLPGVTKYVVDPKNCNHRSQAGRWLPTKVVDGVARCPRCGESALIYRESA